MSVKSKIKQQLKRGRSVSHAVRRKLRGQSTFIYSMDNPKKPAIGSKRLTVDGWLIPQGSHQVKAMRLRTVSKRYPVEYGINRADVARSHPGHPTTIAGKSGFSVDITFEEGPMVLEVDMGRGFKVVHEMELHYSTETLPQDLYNPHLNKNFAEHINLIETRKKLYWEPARDRAYDRRSDDPRLLAFYLPQFHPIPENDQVWGKGFTEWTNVTTAQPRFVGHQQPILPADLGFYDLRLESTLKEQIDLARQHGIYGFCFYYYWFSGRRLLEAPLDSFLRHTEWDFNFSICWANENWTKRWDGRENEVIVAQEYKPDDPLHFIQDIEAILLDPRYIKEDGKPVLSVYRASELKDPARYTAVWRQYFKEKHQLELHLVAVVSFDDTDPREYGFDAAIDFAPQSSFFKNSSFTGNKYPFLHVTNKLLDINFEGTVADYRQVALNGALDEYFSFPKYPCIAPAWDNDARRKGKGFIMVNNNPDLYFRWLRRLITTERKQKAAPLIFINAWNEWAEGAILEPTNHYGHAILNRTTEALALESKNSNWTPYGFQRSPKTKLAVVVHLYYPERWTYIKRQLEHLGDTPYDLFITMNEKDNDFMAELESHPKLRQVITVPNRGRDILPFVYMLERLQIAGYSQILKLHSKKSLHRENGSDWFEELVGQLLPSRDVVNQVLSKLQAESTIVGPNGHYLNLFRYMGSDRPHLQTLLNKIFGKTQAKKMLSKKLNYGYFAGSMFWASMSALQPLIDLHLTVEDFESESGQVDGTLAHAIERLLSVMLQINNQSLWQSSSSGLKKVSSADALRDYNYAE